MSAPRLYTDLAWVWPFVSQPEEYIEEVVTFRRKFQQKGIPDGSTILHLGSGAGCIDYHLKQHYKVTGVDISANMREHATTLNPEVEYLHGDIRDVRVGRTFDAVLLHDASSYMTSIEDLQAAYQTAADHLKPGGVMITLPEEIRSRFLQHKTSANTVALGDRVVSVMQVDFDPDPTDTWYEYTFVFLIREGDQITVEVDTHRCGLFHLDEMLKAMRQVGFELEVSQWELSDLDPEEDHPMVTGVKQG